VIPAAPQDVVYGLGRIDASGRVGDRAVTSVLGWRPGDRLILTAAAGLVRANRSTSWRRCAACISALSRTG
jgi:hypothetical protein